MDKTQHKDLERQIKKRIASLEKLCANSASAEDAEKNLPDSPQETSLATDSRATASALRELARLKDNLKWLASDDAGFCQACGCEIPFARLQAIPTTRLCINCAE